MILGERTVTLTNWAIVLAGALNLGLTKHCTKSWLPPVEFNWGSDFVLWGGLHLPN